MDAELKRVEAALVHDLNNYLQVVMGNLELLKRKGGGAPEIVEAAISATRNAAHLADRLVAFGRLKNCEPRELDLNRVVRDLGGMVQAAAGDAVRVDMQFASALPAAHADPQHVQAALLELASLARSTMPNGGRLTLRTLSGGGEVLLEAGGIARERLASALAPEGALYLVDRCMRQAGGRIEAGATFRLYAPTK